jgi:hypothetical protein
MQPQFRPALQSLDQRVIDKQLSARANVNCFVGRGDTRLREEYKNKHK